MIDQDVVNDDPIGVVELAQTDLDATRAAGHIYSVKVNEQAQNQVLFVGISVLGE